MGIQGFLPLFDKVQQKVNVKQYAGKRVAVDGSVWLHRGAFACAKELALNQPTTAYVSYFMRQVEYLQYQNVDPVIVFDGETLPIKKYTNDQRLTKRQAAREQAMDYLRHGQLQQSVECFQRAIHITPQMVQQVIKCLNDRKIKYIHSPYEADAQLTYLCKMGMVSAVITEDSDLLVFGCPIVLLKMNAYGDAIQIRHQDLFKKISPDLDFSSWDLPSLQHMCILSGCDYLPSIPGVGLKTAYKLLSKFKNIDKIIQYLRAQKKTKIPSSYEEEFRKASYAFLYQYVYNPKTKSCTQMTRLPSNISIHDLDFLGSSPDDFDSPATTPLQSSSSSSSSPSRAMSTKIKRWPSSLIKTPELSLPGQKDPIPPKHTSLFSKEVSTCSHARPLGSITNNRRNMAAFEASRPSHMHKDSDISPGNLEIEDDVGKENIPPSLTKSTSFGIKRPQTRISNRSYSTLTKSSAFTSTREIEASTKKQKVSLMNAEQQSSYREMTDCISAAVASASASIAKLPSTHIPQHTPPACTLPIKYVSIMELVTYQQPRKRKRRDPNMLTPTSIITPSTGKRARLTSH